MNPNSHILEPKYHSFKHDFSIIQSVCVYICVTWNFDDLGINIRRDFTYLLDGVIASSYRYQYFSLLALDCDP